MEPAAYFITEKRQQQLLTAKQQKQHHLDHSDDKYGTVGAVALDSYGHLAAATSTGGMTNKQYGRIGDSPLIGAGTYANNQVAVSCTGIGELFIKHVAAFDIAAQIKCRHISLQDAAGNLIRQTLPKGSGGIIAIDKNGHTTMPFNTLGMFRGIAGKSGMETFIWDN
jgi:beta-aspartyl-peptidase (threonine type)